MEEKAIELFLRFHQLTMLYRANDGEYFIQEDDCQAYILNKGSGSYIVVNRITPLPELPSEIENSPIWVLVANPLTANKALGFDGCISFTTVALDTSGEEVHATNRTGAFSVGHYVILKARTSPYRAKYGQITAIDENDITVNVLRIYGTDANPIDSWELILTGQIITSYEIAQEQGYTGTAADWVNDGIQGYEKAQAARDIAVTKADEAATSAANLAAAVTAAQSSETVATTKAAEAAASAVGLDEAVESAEASAFTASNKADEAVNYASTASTKASEALASANYAGAKATLAEDYLNALTAIDGDLGAYNAATNTPTLSATPSGALADGKYYTVTVGGAVGFGGSNFSSGAVVNTGDRLLKLSDNWFLVISDKTINFRSARVLNFGGYLSINSTTRKISTTGRIFVVANGSYIDIVSAQAEADWNSTDESGMHFIVFNASSNLFEIIRYNSISGIDFKICYLLGTISKPASGIRNAINKISYDTSFPFILNGNLVGSNNNLSSRSGKVLSTGGFIKISTSASTIEVTGACFIMLNGIKYDLPAQSSTPWDSSNGTQAHYVIYRISTAKVAVINFNNIDNYDASDFVLIGVAATNSIGASKVEIDGDFILNDNKILKANSSEYLKYKTGFVTRFDGDLVINTTTRKISTTGKLFITYNLGYYQVTDALAESSWDSDTVGSINYILFHTTNKTFHVVKYDKTTYSSEDYLLIGFVTRAADSKIQVHANGAVVVDGNLELLSNKLDKTGISTLETKVSELVNQTEYNNSLIGALDYQEFDTDYAMIPFYGQSLSMGWQAEIALTTTPVSGCKMVGDSVWIAKGNDGSSTFSDLVASVETNVGESPAVAAIHSFKRLFDRFHRKGGAVTLVTSNSGEGGKSIEQLSKECTNGTNWYNSTFLPSITRAKTAADNLNKTIGVPAIVFMQGEYNYPSYISGTGLTSGSDATSDKDEYKALLLILKNNMQADVVTATGQTSPPLFFIYQVAGGYISTTDMAINMAQLEFAEENPDVILMNPTYAMPDYSNGHMTANGYRWYGEMIAKALYRTFLQGENGTGVLMKKVEIVDSKTIDIDFLVPVAPLLFDTWTTNAQSNMGFRVKIDEVATTISNTEIIGGNKVRIKLLNPLTSGTVEVFYAGVGRNGAGNLRDSDNWISRYEYADDSAAAAARYVPLDAVGGSNLIGKKYPCQNWASNFYFSLNY